MHKSLAFYLSILGIISALFLVRRLRSEAPAALPVSPPSTAPFAQSIGGQAIIESVEDNVRVAAPTPGLISQVLVKVGDQVESGTCLFRLDQREALAQLRVQEAQIPVLEAQLVAAQATEAACIDQYNRTKALSTKQVVSQEEGQKVKFALASAQAQVKRAQADLELARQQLAQSRVRVDLLSVLAPRAGKVLQVNVRPGEYASLQAADPPVLLGRTDVLQLRADIDEDSAPQVCPGCRAVAFIKGKRQEAIPLRFERIEPYIVPKRSLTGASGERVDTRVLQVIFRFDPPKVPLYVGQQMDVYLDAAQQPSKLAESSHSGQSGQNPRQEQEGTTR